MTASPSQLNDREQGRCPAITGWRLCLYYFFLPMVSPMVTAAIRREIIRMTVASISASVTGHPPFAFVVHERDEKPGAICCPSGHIYSIIAHIYLSIAPNNFAMRSLARLHPALAPPVLFPAGQKRAYARRKRVPGFFSMGEGAPPQRRLTSSEDESGDCAAEKKRAARSGKPGPSLRLHAGGAFLSRISDSPKKPQSRRPAYTGGRPCGG